MEIAWCTLVSPTRVTNFNYLNNVAEQCPKNRSLINVLSCAKLLRRRSSFRIVLYYDGQVSHMGLDKILPKHCLTNNIFA